MPITPPRTDPNAPARRYLSGLSVPHLWGRGEEYGIDYPFDVVPEEGTTGPDEAAAIVDRSIRAGGFSGVPVIDRNTGEVINLPPEKPKTPTRQEVVALYTEKFGDPYEFDVDIETAKAMQEEEKKIQEKFELPVGGDRKLIPAGLRKAYNEAITKREAEIYSRKYQEKQDKIKHFETVMNLFEKRQKEETRAARVEEEAEIKERVKAKYREPKEPSTLEQARMAFVAGTATDRQLDLLKRDSASMSRLDVIAKSVGVDLDKPITVTDAEKVVAKLEQMGDSFLMAMFRGALQGAQSQPGNPMSSDQQKRLKELQAKKGK